MYIKRKSTKRLFSIQKFWKDPEYRLLLLVKFIQFFPTSAIAHSNLLNWKSILHMRNFLSLHIQMDRYNHYKFTGKLMKICFLLGKDLFVYLRCCRVVAIQVPFFHTLNPVENALDFQLLVLSQTDQTHLPLSSYVLVSPLVYFS